MLYPSYYILAASLPSRIMKRTCSCSPTIMALHRTFLRFSDVQAFIQACLSFKCQAHGQINNLLLGCCSLGVDDLLPSNSLWPFWDGENVTLSKANRDLQRSGIKGSRLESPGRGFLLSKSNEAKFSQIFEPHEFTGKPPWKLRHVTGPVPLACSTSRTVTPVSRNGWRRKSEVWRQKERVGSVEGGRQL